MLYCRLVCINTDISVRAGSKNNRVSYWELYAALYVPRSNRILLSRMWGNKSGVCPYTWEVHTVILLSSDCPLYCNSRRMVYDQPDHRMDIRKTGKNRYAFSGNLFMDCARNHPDPFSGQKSGACNLADRSSCIIWCPY